MLIFNPQLNLPKYKTRVSAKFYANQRLFTKSKSLILQLYYLPISELQNPEISLPQAEKLQKDPSKINVGT